MNDLHIETIIIELAKEQSVLTKSITILKEFLTRDESLKEQASPSLRKSHCDLLKKQVDIMSEYHTVLSERLLEIAIHRKSMEGK